MPQPNSLAGIDPSQFFQNSPDQRLAMLSQMQQGEMSPEELMLQQLLKKRKDAYMPTHSPAHAPQAAQQTGIMQQLMALLGGQPASDAMAQANAQYQRGR